MKQLWHRNTIRDNNIEQNNNGMSCNVWIYISIRKRKENDAKNFPFLMIGFSFPQFHEYIKNSLNLYTLSFRTLKQNETWTIRNFIASLLIKTKKHLIFREKILTFMNFHCNEACILCSMYVWKLFWGNPFHFCLSILLADVYSYLICLLHSNVNSSQYMSKWMTCIILIIMRYFIICFDRSCKDNPIQWYHYHSIYFQ